MYQRWVCTHDDKSYVEYYTQAVSLDEILEDFRLYLQGAGFVFKMTDELVKIDTEEEEQELINYVYIVSMLRWGSRENHSYVLGAFSTIEQAEEAAEIEEQNRAGKYERCIERFSVDTLLFNDEGAILK